MKRSSATGDARLEPYAPINVLKPVAADVWIVDGPEASFRRAGFSLPFTTRMTVIRLSGGDLLLHSPVPHDAELEGALKALGPIAYLLAPNSLHYWWISGWRDRYPKARVFAVREPSRRAKPPIVVDAILDDRSPWPDDIALLLVASDVMTEAVLFHRRSRTLVLSNLIENVELQRVRSGLSRCLIRARGVADPDGKTPIDLRWTFLRTRGALFDAVLQMIDWRPERIIVGHGRWYPDNAVAELRRAFRWLW